MNILNIFKHFSCNTVPPPLNLGFTKVTDREENSVTTIYSQFHFAPFGDCVTHRKPMSVRMLIFAFPFLARHCLKLLRFSKMPTCGYSEFVGGSCSSRKTSGESKCIALTKCKRDIQGHLKTYKCHDAQLKSEFILLLAWAGKYLIIKDVKNV